MPVSDLNFYSRSLLLLLGHNGGGWNQHFIIALWISKNIMITTIERRGQRTYGKTWCIQRIPNRNGIELKFMRIQTDVATLKDMGAHHLPIFLGLLDRITRVHVIIRYTGTPPHKIEKGHHCSYINDKLRSRKLLR